MCRNILMYTALITGGTAIARSQTLDSAATRPVLYVVGTSHLDTQWRWHIRTTINEYVPATFADNFKLMDQYPNYKFSYEGSFRYQLLKEYRPDLYERLRTYIASGQWRPTGSWVDAVDVNVPSFESLVRHTLYGNGFFKREFGVTSRDVYLPDCFGFGYALPSIAAHCGLRSFSTQKLTWGSWVGIPFDIGVWEGVDGSSLLAAVNPGEYVSRIEGDLSTDTLWLGAAERLRKATGWAAAYRYFGTGDIGGAPDSTSVAWLDKSLRADGPLAVKSIGADEIIDAVTPEVRAKLPRYRGELLMTRHGVGCYTSQAAMKRWNRRNELLADAAERASVTAALFGGIEYPTDFFRDTWERFLWHQFHDDVTGTSIPEAYEFSWNDEILCQNRSAGLLEHAAGAITPVLDTRAKGVPVVVYNPVSGDREDLVEATIRFEGRTPSSVRVIGPEGKEVPSQVLAIDGDWVSIVFLARVPSVGWTVYDVRESSSAYRSTELSVTAQSLENDRYRVAVDQNGDVSSIFDKHAQRELLSAPIQFELLFDKPNAWPSWEIDYDEVQAAPRALVSGPAQFEIVEQGPARVAIRITRRTERSEFRTTISLAAGEPGGRVVFDNEIDWFERETLLKCAFHCSTPNEHVTYDLGLGTIQRGRNHPKLYEVPGQQWADLTSRQGDYGVAVLNDCRYGWDHPDSSTVRLSLIHTPGVYDSWSWVEDQRSQDNGRHQLSFAIVGHRGDWRSGEIVKEAACFNQPLICFRTEAHAGQMGKSLSLVGVETLRDSSIKGKVMINAIKQAEATDEIVIRVRETAGIAVPDAAIRFAFPILAAREINGSEEPLAPATLDDGALRTSFGPYQPRSFAVRLDTAAHSPIRGPISLPLELPFNLDGISRDDDRRDGNFENGRTLAGELLPDTLVDLDIVYVTGPKSPGLLNALSCDGQTLSLPNAQHNEIRLLATAVEGPAEATFSIDGRDTSIWIQNYAMPITQWNNRLVAGAFVEEPDRIAPGYINRQPVAWYGSHTHDSSGQNEAYQFSYFYRISLPLPEGAHSLSLPREPRIRILAATAVSHEYDATRPAQPLYDVMSASLPRITAPRNSFVDSLIVHLSTPTPGAQLHYTVDGSDPSEGSALYTGPLTMVKTTTLKARAVKPGVDDTYVAMATFNQLGMWEPASPTQTDPGLSCTYYEGSWDSLPWFDTLKVIRRSVIDSVDIPSYARDEDYGLVLTGFVSVPSDGLYDFFLGSDDGSDLRLRDSLLIDNDGLHGMGDVSGAVGLKAGIYPIHIRMFQKKGDEGLRLLVEGPGFRKSAVPASWLSHSRATGRASRE